MEINKVTVTAVWLEALFYGINSVLVWSCLFVLSRKAAKRNSDKLLICIIVLQYLVSTVDVSIGLARIITEFVKFSDRTTVYISDMPEPLNVAQLLLIATNSVLNDYVVVWRCYHVWRKDWMMVAFPATLAVGTIFSIVGLGISLCDLDGGHDIFNPNTVPWFLSLYSLALSTNVVGTSLIAFGIWSTLRQSSIGATYSKLLLLLTESGVLYSASLLVALGLYLSQAESFYIVYVQLGQLASIIPTMIVLLVGLGYTADDQVRVSTVCTTTGAAQESSTSTTRPVAIGVVTTTDYSYHYDLKGYLENLRSDNTAGASYT